MRKVLLQQTKMQKEDEEYMRYVAKLFHQERNKELAIRFLEKHIRILQVLSLLQ